MAAANFTIGVPNTPALRRLRGRVQRRHRAHVPGHELAGRAERRRTAAVGPPARLIAEYERYSRRTSMRRGARPVSVREARSRWMPTCLVDLVRPEAGVAAVRVLRRAGYRVTFPGARPVAASRPGIRLSRRGSSRRGHHSRRPGRQRGADRRVSKVCAATMLHAWPGMFGGRRPCRARAGARGRVRRAACAARERGAQHRRPPEGGLPLLPATSGEACATPPRARR
jgi:hypothetical protein